MKDRQIPASRLTTNNVILKTHEYITINTLLASGIDVELIQKSRTPHSKATGVFMLSSIWEIKSPTGKTNRAIERILHRAAHQSENIIFDFRRIPIPDSKIITFLTKTPRVAIYPKNIDYNKIIPS